MDDKELATYEIGFSGLPEYNGEFGYVLDGSAAEGQSWKVMNWRHNPISSEGVSFKTVVAGKSAPFYQRGKYAYPIMEDAREDFFRAGAVGTMRRREEPGFNEFYSAIAANVDALWIPGRMWTEIQESKNRNNFKHWLVESKSTAEIMRGYIARLGRTRIYTDAFVNTWSEQFLNDGMYTLKMFDDVERRADPLGDMRLCVVEARKGKGKRFMLEKDVSDQVIGIFDLLDRCPDPTHIRSGVNWDKVLQE